jgi:hypothetical protein
MRHFIAEAIYRLVVGAKFQSLLHIFNTTILRIERENVRNKNECVRYFSLYLETCERLCA